MNNKAEDILWVSQIVLFSNKNVFEKLVKKYQSPLRRFFLNLTNGDGDTSNDLAQETFIKAYLHLNSFKGAAKFSTWLFRIGYNVFYYHVKQGKTHVVNDDNELPTAWEDKHDKAGAIEKKMDIKEALGILREEEKTAVVLCYMEEFTHPQIAEIMNCPIGTVKSYILRGKAKLHNYFKNNGYGTRHI